MHATFHPLLARISEFRRSFGAGESAGIRVGQGIGIPVDPPRIVTLQTATDQAEAEPAPSKPANAKPPDIASASVPDTLAALHVNPETGLTHAEVDTPPEGARLQRGGRAERAPGPQVPRKILGPVRVDARADHVSVARAAKLLRSRHCRRTTGRQCRAGLCAERVPRA